MIKKELKIFYDSAEYGYKICHKCLKILLNTEEFFSVGHHWCKQCTNECSKKYYLNNKEKINNYGRVYRMKYPDKESARRIKYRKEHKESVAKSNRKRLKERLSVDVGLKLRFYLGHRISDALKRNIKSQPTKKLIGCPLNELVKYLESKFQTGMTWDNYGRGKDKWHVDHIIPCAYFDLSNPIQQAECFHYTNLQPLWQHENLTKSSIYNGKIYRHETIV